MNTTDDKTEGSNKAEDEKVKQGAENKEEETEDEKEVEHANSLDSFTLGDYVWEEEEEEIPHAQEEEVKIDASKQQKEEPIDKDLIYRENEEEVFDSDQETEMTIASQLPKSEDDDLPPDETDPLLQLNAILEEELKYEISFADIARGFMKEAYEEELRVIEEKRKLEEERKRLDEEKKKLEMEKPKRKASAFKKKEEKHTDIKGELCEEGSEEEEEEEEEDEESIQKETLPSTEEDEFEFSKVSDGSKTDKQLPFLTDPKYALLRRLANTLKCKDLVQRIPDTEPTRKRRVKKVLVKKSKDKAKVQTPVEEIPEVKEIPQVPEAGKGSVDEESLTGVKASDLKSGLPLLEYFAQIGVTPSAFSQEIYNQDEPGAQDNKEEVTAPIITVPKEEIVSEKGSELSSSGLSIGRTESSLGSEASKDESLSINEEEEEKGAKTKPDESGEEEEDLEDILIF